MRTFRVVKDIPNVYISVDVEYTLNSLTDSVYYCRNQKEVSCSYMSTSKFKRALREGAIVFTD